MVSHKATPWFDSIRSILGLNYHRSKRSTRRFVARRQTAWPRAELLEDRVVPAFVDLMALGDYGGLNGALFSTAEYGAGTGNIDPFVRISHNGTEAGYNSSAHPPRGQPNPEFDETNQYDSQYNYALSLSSIPIAYIYNSSTNTFDAYREFRLDINQVGGACLSLDALQVYQSTSSTLYGFTGSPTSTGTFTSGGDSYLRYNLDEGGDNAVLLNYALQAGSGVGDVSVFIPDSAFDPAQEYVYLYSAFGFTQEASE